MDFLPWKATGVNLVLSLYSIRSKYMYVPPADCVSVSSPSQVSGASTEFTEVSDTDGDVYDVSRMGWAVG